VAKKNFKGGLDSLLQSTTTSTNIPPVVSKSDNVKPNELRATFIVREDYLEKMLSTLQSDNTSKNTETLNRFRKKILTCNINKPMH
jgi:hypothetical protein